MIWNVCKKMYKTVLSRAEHRSVAMANELSTSDHLKQQQVDHIICGTLL